MVNIAATSKRSCTSKANVLFYVMFSSFRWRRTNSNGTGGCIFKKVGVRKTIVITSITFLPELSLVFFRNHAYEKSSILAQGERIPSVARPIFVNMIKEYVQAIQNYTLSSFRSKNFSTSSVVTTTSRNSLICSFTVTTSRFLARISGVMRTALI